MGRWEEATEAGRLAAVEAEVLTPRERQGELAWLNLRTSAGIEVDDFAVRLGVDPRERFAKVVDRLVRAGLMEDVGTHLRLTEKGWPVADGVASEFL